MKLARNSLYSLASMLIPLLVSLAIIPVYISTIGAARYGALALVWLLLGYFGAADFGIGRAVAQRVAALKDAAAQARAKTVWSATILISGLGLVLAAASWLAGHLYFSGGFSAEPGLQAELIEASWLLAPCVLVLALSGVPVGALSGIERFGDVAIGNLTGYVAMQVLPLVAALSGYDTIQQMVLAVLAGRMLGLVILVLGVWRHLLRGHDASASREVASRLLRFGMWIMLGAVVGPLMIITDRFVIGWLAGAVAVAAYTIPFQLAYRSLVFPAALTQALFPRLAALTEDEARAQARRYTLIIAQSFTPVAIAFVVLAGPLFALWLGPDLDPRSVAVAQWVMIGVWANAIGQVPINLIQARGDSRFTGLLHLAEYPIYVAVLFALGARFGLVGFAAAFAIRCFVDAAILLVKAKLLDRKFAMGLLLPITLLCAATALAWSSASFATLIGGAVIMATAAGVYAVWAMPSEFRARMRSFTP